MFARITSNEIWTKALRIALAFSLMFWVSFRVECLAFAVVSTDKLDAHAGEEPTSLKVYRIDTDDDHNLVIGKEMAESGEELDTAHDYQISTVDDSLRLGAVVTWKEVASQPDNPSGSSEDKDKDKEKEKEKDKDKDDEGAEGNENNNTGNGEGKTTEPGDEPVDGQNGTSTEGAPSPIRTQASDDSLANYVEWSLALPAGVEGNAYDVADFARNGDGKITDADQGLVTLVGKKSGTVIVTCTLKNGEATLEAAFRVTVKEPYVNAGYPPAAHHHGQAVRRGGGAFRRGVQVLRVLGPCGRVRRC